MDNLHPLMRALLGIALIALIGLLVWAVARNSDYGGAAPDAVRAGRQAAREAR